MKTYENPSKSPVPSRGALHFHSRTPCRSPFPGQVHGRNLATSGTIPVIPIVGCPLPSLPSIQCREAAKDGWSGISPLRSVSLHMILRGFRCFREVWNMWKRIGVSVVFVEFGRPTLQSPGTPSFWLEYGWTSWPGSHEPLPICRQILWPQPNSKVTSS